MKVPRPLALLLLLPATLLARGPLPPVTEAVTVHGVRYSVAVVKTETEFGVDILAERLKDSTLLSRTPVYRIRYQPGTARDLQEVYPVSLEIRGNDVIVTREDDLRYGVSLSGP